MRVFAASRTGALGDCAPSGRVRLDALARWLQDVAYDDVEDAGLADSAVWVVRRTRISVRRWPRFAERVRLATLCSGVGRAWAERRTTIALAGDEAAPDVETVALWVHLDPASWRPMPFSEHELGVYGAPERDRRLSARLRHPAPPPQTERERGWEFRAAECDIAGHLNNAAFLTVLDEEWLEHDAEPGRIDVEIEYRTPAQPGAHRVLAEGPRRWIVGARGEVHASILIDGLR